MKFFEDGFTTLYQSDARSMTEIPDNTVQCVVTSPPYWGLRKYKGEQDLVWGGKMDCRHEWIVTPPRRSHKDTDIVNLESKEASNRGNLGSELPDTNTCSLCGAWRGAYGLEPTPELYVQHSIDFLREVRRVLRKDGCVFWNIGDSYAGSGSQGGDDYLRPYNRKGFSLKPKDLCLIPQRLAIACQQDGWWVRSIIIWSKNNPMPESVNGWRFEKCRVKVGDNGRGKEAWRLGANETPQQDHDKNGNFQNSAVRRDCPGCPKCEKNGGYVLRKGNGRPTDSYEQILMLTKTDSYFCDREAVLEPIAQSTIGRGKVSFGGAKGRAYNPDKDDPNFRNGSEQWGREYDYTKSNGNGGRNLRSVLMIPTSGSKIKHFATYPPRLIEPLIKAATSEKGCCPKCGSPWARVIDRQVGFSKDCPKTIDAHIARGGSGYPSGTVGRAGSSRVDGVSSTIGWLPTCVCDTTKPPVPSIVLDCFAGSGTTLWVAKKLGRRAIGYEISEEYCKMALERNRQGALI